MRREKHFSDLRISNVEAITFNVITVEPNLPHELGKRLTARTVGSI